MSKRGIKLYLEDIKDAVRKIEKYTRAVDFDKFYKDEQDRRNRQKLFGYR